MNTFYVAALRVALPVLYFCLSLSLQVKAETVKTTAEDITISERVTSMYSIVDMKYTDEVAKVIKQYTKRYPKTSAKLLGQSSIYFPIIENILRERGMPDELKYLAVVESGLRPAVKSRVGATGMWQFMRSTGKMYGLTINRTVDERRDVIKSTHSAIDYLTDLHDRFGDWALAMAAYNAGPGKVNRAIRKAKSKDFWKVAKYLPRETRRYVPKFIAMQYMMSYYHMHDITPEMPEQHFMNLASAKVYDEVNFRTLSKQLDISLATLKQLNPSYIRNYIPKCSSGQHHITLPESKIYDFAIASGDGSIDFVYQKPRPKVLRPVKQESRPLETVASLSILPTQVYVAGHEPTRHTNGYKTAMHTKQYTSRTHRLSKGESLVQVAKSYDIPLRHLLDINDIQDVTDVRIGDELLLN